MYTENTCRFEPVFMCVPAAGRHRDSAPGSRAHVPGGAGEGQGTAAGRCLGPACRLRAIERAEDIASVPGAAKIPAVSLLGQRGAAATERLPHQVERRVSWPPWVGHDSWTCE